MDLIIVFGFLFDIGLFFFSCWMIMFGLNVFWIMRIKYDLCLMKGECCVCGCKFNKWNVKIFVGMVLVGVCCGVGRVFWGDLCWVSWLMYWWWVWWLCWLWLKWGLCCCCYNCEFSDSYVVDCRGFNNYNYWWWLYYCGSYNIYWFDNVVYNSGYIYSGRLVVNSSRMVGVCCNRRCVVNSVGNCVGDGVGDNDSYCGDDGSVDWSFGDFGNGGYCVCGDSCDCICDCMNCYECVGFYDGFLYGV